MESCLFFKKSARNWISVCKKKIFSLWVIEYLIATTKYDDGQRSALFKLQMYVLYWDINSCAVYGHIWSPARFLRILYMLIQYVNHLLAFKINFKIILHVCGEETWVVSQRALIYFIFDVLVRYCFYTRRLLCPLEYRVRSRVQKFPAWHTKAPPNGKYCEGYIVPSMVRLKYQLKSVEIKGDYVEK